MKVKTTSNEDGVVQWKNEENITISYHNFVAGTPELHGLSGCVLISPKANFKWVVRSCELASSRRALCESRTGEHTKRTQL